jgi:peptide/nickel transport system permease protein
VSFTLSSRRTIGLVGQSGSGKSTIAKILTQLETPTRGEVLLDGAPIPRRGKGLRRYRQQLRMVFQDPFASLNPYHSIRHHVERPLRLDHVVPRREVDAEVRRLLERVRLDPDAVMERRPHELSGGQRQRVAIARALASRPALLVADEPVSMLDVSIRLGVLNLLADLQREEGSACSTSPTTSPPTPLQRRDHGAQPGQGRGTRPRDVILTPRTRTPGAARRIPRPGGVLPRRSARPPEVRDERRHVRARDRGRPSPRRPSTRPSSGPRRRRPNAADGSACRGGSSRRAAFYLFTAWAAITINFFIPRLMKGDAVDSYMARSQGQLTPDAEKALRLMFGLDSSVPLWQQYLDYWGMLLRGDLGVSISTGMAPVGDAIAAALPWTLGLVGFATIVSFLVGTSLGAVVGWRRGGRLGRAGPVTTFLGTDPYFWLGLIFIAVFATVLGWFPAGALRVGVDRAGTPTSSDRSLARRSGDHHRHRLPRRLVLGMRNMMLTVLDEDYITVAKRGMPNRRVLWRYAARNAVLPQIQSFALSRLHRGRHDRDGDGVLLSGHRPAAAQRHQCEGLRAHAGHLPRARDGGSSRTSSPTSPTPSSTRAPGRRRPDHDDSRRRPAARRRRPAPPPLLTAGSHRPRRPSAQLRASLAMFGNRKSAAGLIILGIFVLVAVFARGSRPTDRPRSTSTRRCSRRPGSICSARRTSARTCSASSSTARAACSWSASSPRSWPPWWRSWSA